VRLTITATAPVPYTSITVSSSAEFFDLTEMGIAACANKLMADVDAKVADEMKRLNIKLGPDGLRAK